MMPTQAIEAAAPLGPTALQIMWFVLFAVLIIGYAILDGFDLGVGILSLFGQDDGERRLYVNAIAPVWDGNEVWLLTAGGALFAAFPPVYATVFSGFYLAIMLLLVALILRAVSMEFRGKVDAPRWRRVWDLAFGVGSLLATLLFGVAVGNILRGIPLDARGEFAGTFLGLLHPFPLLVGLLTVAMFTSHGALYMAMKSEGELRQRMRAWASRAWIAWVALYVAATVGAFFFAPFLFEGVLKNPLTWAFFALTLASLVYLPIGAGQDRPLRAFIASSLAILAMNGLAAVSLFPRLVPALGDLSRSLTIMNASSTERALMTMLVIALIGVPLVLVYTVFIYSRFKGKVEIDEDSY
jgi:cytochrome bd ubiquinol oxidase subunit II